MGSHDFLSGFLDNFSDLEILLKKLLTEEELLKNNILVKSGFIIKSYSVKIEIIDFKFLEELKNEVQNILKIETKLKEDLNNNMVELRKIGRDYFSRLGNLHLGLLPQYLNNSFDCSRNLFVIFDQLTKLLQINKKLNIKSGKDTERLIISLENNISQIMKFIELIKQILKKIQNFEKDAYYPEPRTYGRACSLKEFKKMSKENSLSSPKDPTPVFDAPQSTINKILAMSRDDRKNFFSSIGVVGATVIIFFQTRLKPVNFKNPIPQSNGLKEFKFPKNTPIEIIAQAA